MWGDGSRSPDSQRVQNPEARKGAESFDSLKEAKEPQEAPARRKNETYSNPREEERAKPQIHVKLCSDLGIKCL